MVEILRLKNTDLKHCEETFGLYLPYSDIKPITYDNLPRGLKKQIDGEENCGLSFKVVHPDSSVTFVAEFTGFEVFFLQDRNNKDRYAGEGRIYVESGEESEIPIVGFTYTSREFRRKGLGTRRLFVMNALSRTKFESPINSSNAPKPAQRSIWERLVEEEIAETHYWEGTQRYRFIS